MKLANSYRKKAARKLGPFYFKVMSLNLLKLILVTYLLWRLTNYHASELSNAQFGHWLFRTQSYMSWGTMRQNEYATDRPKYLTFNHLLTN